MNINEMTPLAVAFIWPCSALDIGHIVYTDNVLLPISNMKDLLGDHQFFFSKSCCANFYRPQLRHTIYERPVRILLECILVVKVLA